MRLAVRPTRAPSASAAALTGSSSQSITLVAHQPVSEWWEPPTLGSSLSVYLLASTHRSRSGRTRSPTIRSISLPPWQLAVSIMSSRLRAAPEDCLGLLARGPRSSALVSEDHHAETQRRDGQIVPPRSP